MKQWTSVKTAYPNDGVDCVVLQQCADTIDVYPRFTQWDGTEWVDIDGEVVPGVIAWQTAPMYDRKLEPPIYAL